MISTFLKCFLRSELAHANHPMTSTSCLSPFFRDVLQTKVFFGVAFSGNSAFQFRTTRTRSIQPISKLCSRPRKAGSAECSCAISHGVCVEVLPSFIPLPLCLGTTKRFLVDPFLQQPSANHMSTPLVMFCCFPLRGDVSIVFEGVSTESSLEADLLHLLFSNVLCA